MQESIPKKNNLQQYGSNASNSGNENCDANLPQLTHASNVGKRQHKEEDDDDNYPKTLFSGCVRNYVQCSSCKNISMKEDHIEDLQLV
jgi:hypothetical protein